MLSHTSQRSESCAKGLRFLLLNHDHLLVHATQVHRLADEPGNASDFDAVPFDILDFLVIIHERCDLGALLQERPATRSLCKQQATNVRGGEVPPKSASAPSMQVRIPSAALLKSQCGTNTQYSASERGTSSAFSCDIRVIYVEENGKKL